VNEYKDWTRQDLVDHIEELDRDAFDLIAKVVELINKLSWDENDKLGWDKDDKYTFMDGDVWRKFDPLAEDNDDE
jgi:hypothetical protein